MRVRARPQSEEECIPDFCLYSLLAAAAIAASPRRRRPPLRVLNRSSVHIHAPAFRLPPLSPRPPARDAAFPWKRAEKAGLLSADHQSGISKSCNGLTKSRSWSLDLIFITARK